MKLLHLPKHQERAKGFTIMELLVATVVFSVVLLVVTAGILQIARVYYKGVTESSTQNTARSIIDTVSQAIQFSGGNVTATAGSPTPGSSYAFCVGNQQFSYTLGWQVENNPYATKNQTWHALVQDTAAGCSSSSAPQNVRNQEIHGRDLMGSHMRLANLSVTPVGTNQYRVQVRVVYGDNDLLFNPTATTASCRGFKAGTQFCSVADLSTVVVKRVE
jgi:prepilin-type N-terminal cleavage/methylation domain-containing protein